MFKTGSLDWVLALLALLAFAGATLWQLAEPVRRANVWALGVSVGLALVAAIYVFG